MRDQCCGSQDSCKSSMCRTVYPDKSIRDEEEKEEEEGGEEEVVVWGGVVVEDWAASSGRV